MFVGHLAVALAAKRLSPRAPLAALVAAAYGLDLLWPFLLLAGIERVRVDTAASAFTPLVFEHYPWSHSLSMATIWSVGAGRLAASLLGNAVAGAVIGFVVLSHWLLDFVVHVPDLPLWPGGPRVGLGVWNSIPGTLSVEGALVALCTVLYVRGTRPVGTAGRWALWSLLAFTGLIWVSQPFSPPPPGVGAIAWVGLALWILPLWGWWIDRTREATSRGRRSRS